MDRASMRYHGVLAPIVLSAVGRVAAHRATQWLPGPAQARARRWFQGWCRTTAARLGVGVETTGAVPVVPCVFVANHRSYLDVVVLGGLLNGAFLSRADVASWWLVGFAATAIGTVFLDRDDPRSRVRAARGIGRALRRGSVIVFPEGTTGGERLPRPFAAGVFRLLARLDAPVVPVTIRYSDRQAYWVDTVPMAAHLREHVLAAPLTATVHVGTPQRAAGFADADAFGAAAYAAVCEPIERLGELARAAPPAGR